MAAAPRLVNIILLHRIEIMPNPLLLLLRRGHHKLCHSRSEHLLLRLLLLRIIDNHHVLFIDRYVIDTVCLLWFLGHLLNQVHTVVRFVVRVVKCATLRRRLHHTVVHAWVRRVIKKVLLGRSLLLRLDAGKLGRVAAVTIARLELSLLHLLIEFDVHTLVMGDVHHVLLIFWILLFTVEVKTCLA